MNLRSGLRVKPPHILGLQVYVVEKAVKVKDISLTGICFYTRKTDSSLNFGEGEHIELVLKIKDETLYLDVKIIWKYKDSDFKYWGAQFMNVSLNTDAKLSRIITDVQRLELKKQKSLF